MVAKPVTVGVVGVIVLASALVLNYFVLPGEEAESGARAPSPSSPAPEPPKRPDTAAKPVAPSPAARLQPQQPAAVQDRQQAAASTPSFDVVRVDPDGNTVVAGRGAPNTDIAILDDDKEIGRVTSDNRGEWVFVPPAKLKAGERVLTLKEMNEQSRQSDEAVVLVIPEKGKDIAGRATDETGVPLAVVVPRNGSGSDQRVAARVLQAPAAGPLASSDTSSAGSASETAEAGHAVATPADRTGAAASGSAGAAAAGTTSSHDGTSIAAAGTGSSHDGTSIAADAGGGAAADTRNADVAAAGTSASAPAGTVGSTGTQEPKASGAGGSLPVAPANNGSTAVVADVGADGTRQVTGLPAARPAGPSAGTGSDTAAGTAAAPATASASAPGTGEPKSADREPEPTDPTPATPSQFAAAAPVASAYPEPVVAEATPNSAKQKDVAVDVIDYDEKGDVVFSGRADPGARVEVFIDNRKVGDTGADAEGRWTMRPADPVAPGSYQLRVDKVASTGEVEARVAFPFVRADPLTELPSNRLVVIQPGNNLWRIATRVYGEGVRFVEIFDANKDQILDPDLIYPGQVFGLPRVN